MGQPLTLRQALILFVVLVAAWLPSLLKPEIVSFATALHPFGASPNPYFVPHHALLLYFWSPLVAISSCVFFLSPGLLLALAFNRARDFTQWILFALAIMVPALSIPTAIAQATMDQPFRGLSFAAFVVACSLVSFCILLLRVRKAKLAWPLEGRIEKQTMLVLIGAELMIAALMIPKIYWENFTRDGLQVLESSRLLYSQPLPIWPQIEGLVLTYPSFTSMISIYIPSWFVRLFGEMEAPIRFPFLLYVAAVYCGIVSIAGQGQKVTLSRRMVLWLAMAVYIVVVSYNVSYNPYAADIAHPAAREVLVTAFFLGFVFCFLQGERFWTAYFVFLTFFTLPLGTILIALWMAGVLLLWRPRPLRMLMITAIAVIAGQAVAEISPWIQALFNQTKPNDVFSAASLLERFHLDWGSPQRIAYLIIPCSIASAVSLLSGRRQDTIGQTFTFVAVTYFLFFYFQRQIGLNHFVPVMILPLVVHWRLGSESAKRFFVPATAICAVVAFFISLPPDASPDLSSRQIGSAIEDRIGGYEKLDFESLRRQDILKPLLPSVDSPGVPEEVYGGVPWVWYHYAHRKDHQSRTINYVIQHLSDPPPENMWLLHAQGNSALYLRSPEIWKLHQTLKPHSPPGNPIYTVPKESLYKSRKK
ncbi:hypothetical protein L0156_11675 [bacterium]|nr:hypothetical protein [bacterium]